MNSARRAGPAVRFRGSSSTVAPCTAAESPILRSTVAAGAETKRSDPPKWYRTSELPLLGSNQDSPDPESGVLPVTPRGRGGKSKTGIGGWEVGDRRRETGEGDTG